jgi:invasion protein IalB
MKKERSRRSSGRSAMLAALRVLFLLVFGIGTGHAQQPSEKSTGQEFTPRGERTAREIRYSDWRKTCFKTHEMKLVCRTSITGAFETGQSAVRIDLIEREGDKAARLQLFLPVGLYLQAGVRLRVDQGAAYRVPYVWCLTNTCIAADLADHGLLKEMETGHKLLLEVVDSSVLTVATTLPIDRFAMVRRGAPEQTFEQAIGE